MKLKNLLFIGALLGATPAAASQFLLTYGGTLNTVDTLALSSGGPNLLVAATSFVFTARFDDASANLVALVGVPGFVAYSPSSSAIQINGVTYHPLSFGADPVEGIGVAIFDSTTPFGPPGHYAAGFIRNPLADGPGIVGDFAGASPGFAAAHLRPTVFTGFNGAGYGGGFGCVPGPCTIASISLIGPGGVAYSLTFKDRNSGPSPANTASITAVPEPAGWAMMILGFGGIGAAARTRRLGSRVIVA